MDEQVASAVSGGGDEDSDSDSGTNGALAKQTQIELAAPESVMLLFVVAACSVLMTWDWMQSTSRVTFHGDDDATLESKASPSAESDLRSKDPLLILAVDLGASSVGQDAVDRASADSRSLALDVLPLHRGPEQMEPMFTNLPEQMEPEQRADLPSNVTALNLRRTLHLAHCGHSIGQTCTAMH